MWQLVKEGRYPALSPIYTDELLMAIMWEESTFCNVREMRDGGGFGPAVGFGQINDTEFWRFRMPKDVLRAMILGSDKFSVYFVGMMINDLHTRLNNRDTVLRNGYAGVNVNPVNIHAYEGWLAAEKILRSGASGGWMPSKETIALALRAAKPNSVGFIPEVL
jgi:hypothetical protein